MISADPIRVYSEQVITGTVETDAIYASTAGDQGRCDADAARRRRATRRRRACGSRWASWWWRQAASSTSAAAATRCRRRTPGTALQGNDSAGSHLGEGGVLGLPAGETYGSVYTPQENGAGGYFDSGSSGGGAVRITADRVQIDGVIRANGASTCRVGGGRLGVGEGGRAVGCREHRGQGRQLDELRRSLGWRRRDRGGLHDAGAVVDAARSPEHAGRRHSAPPAVRARCTCAGAARATAAWWWTTGR